MNKIATYVGTGITLCGLFFVTACSTTEHTHAPSAQLPPVPIVGVWTLSEFRVGGEPMTQHSAEITFRPDFCWQSTSSSGPTGRNYSTNGTYAVNHSRVVLKSPDGGSEVSQCIRQGDLLIFQDDGVAAATFKKREQ
jgi:hypothetical protein